MTRKQVVKNNKKKFKASGEIKKLPDDVYPNIFLYLEFQFLLTSVELVCKDWARHIKHAVIWSRVRLSLGQLAGNADRTNESLKKFAPYLINVSIHPIFNRPTCLLDSRNLETLKMTVKMLNFNLYHDVLYNCSSTLQELHLALPERSCNGFMKGISKWKDLRLNRLEFICLEGPLELCNLLLNISAPKLAMIALFCHDFSGKSKEKLDLSTLGKALSEMPSLRGLNLSRSLSMNILEVIRPLNSLAHIAFSDADIPLEFPANDVHNESGRRTSISSSSNGNSSSNNNNNSTSTSSSSNNSNGGDSSNSSSSQLEDISPPSASYWIETYQHMKTIGVQTVTFIGSHLEASGFYILPSLTTQQDIFLRSFSIDTVKKFCSSSFDASVWGRVFPNLTELVIPCSRSSIFPPFLLPPILDYVQILDNFPKLEVIRTQGLPSEPLNSLAQIRRLYLNVKKFELLEWQWNVSGMLVFILLCPFVKISFPNTGKVSPENYQKLVSGPSTKTTRLGAVDDIPIILEEEVEIVEEEEEELEGGEVRVDGSGVKMVKSNGGITRMVGGDLKKLERDLKARIKERVSGLELKKDMFAKLDRAVLALYELFCREDCKLDNRIPFKDQEMEALKTIEFALPMLTFLRCFCCL